MVCIATIRNLPMPALNAQLLFNDEQTTHEQTLSGLFSKAVQLDCMAAFANEHGLALILQALKSALKKRLKARFAIGLDFFQTSPKLLGKLLSLSERYDLQLYVKIPNQAYTFHPKIYAFSYADYHCTVVTGSANLTAGGFKHNHEASVVVTDPSGYMADAISLQFDALIERQVLVAANQALIHDYEIQYKLHHAHHNMAQRRFTWAQQDSYGSIQTLKYIMETMKSDESQWGFAAQKKKRATLMTAARDALQQLAKARRLTPQGFLQRYEALINNCYSGGLHRGKTIIAEQSGHFLQGLQTVLPLTPNTPEDAYQRLLTHFNQVPRAGINIITEILYNLDNKRFAVMNQNAVAGLRLAKITDFPSKPNKQNVSAKQYAAFCDQADQIRRALGLANFSELDALFNYAYWQERSPSGDEDGDEEEDDED